MLSIFFFILIDCLNIDVVIGFKANCPLVGPGPIGGMPSVEVFLRVVWCGGGGVGIKADYLNKDLGL